MKQRGSAIIIAVFLIAAIGSLAFSFGRIFLIESRNAVINENGIYAYYAAESGIEEGFLRYRYDRNAEIPYGGAIASSKWKLGENKVFRSNLDRLTSDLGANEGGITGITSILPADTNNQVYDLRMGFIGTAGQPIYGQNVDRDNKFDKNDLLSPLYGTGKFSFLKIPQDEAYKIDLGELDPTKDIRIMAKYASPTVLEKSLLYIKLTVDYDGDGLNINEYKTIITPATVTDTCRVLGRTTDLTVCANELLTTTAVGSEPNDIVWSRDNLLAAFSQFGKKPIINSEAKVTLSIKPLFYDAYIGLSTMDYATHLNRPNQTKSNVVSGPFTTISSTGYFSGMTRTLSADIDRQSGTLYDLFDYVIYQKP